MDFSFALIKLKLGERLVRESTMLVCNEFVYYVAPNSYPAQTGVAKKYYGKEAMVPYNGYFAIKKKDGTVSVWTPSTDDVLAEDWVVI